LSHARGLLELMLDQMQEPSSLPVRARVQRLFRM
jgi:hypothetical protein